jgi:hypothetical protein
MDSQPHAILLGGCIPHVDDGSCVASRHTLFIPALLPASDESAMNFEGVGVSFDMYFGSCRIVASGELTYENGPHANESSDDSPPLAEGFGLEDL